MNGPWAAYIMRKKLVSCFAGVWAMGEGVEGDDYSKPDPSYRNNRWRWMAIEKLSDFLPKSRIR